MQPFLDVTVDSRHSTFRTSKRSLGTCSRMQLERTFTFSLPIITLRPFNTYGPRQSARAVIPTIITQINKNEGIIKLGATSPTRDFNFYKDIIEAFLSAIKSDNGYGEVFNVGIVVSNFII